MNAKPKIIESTNKLKDTAVRIKDSTAHMERSTACRGQCRAAD